MNRAFPLKKAVLKQARMLVLCLLMGGVSLGGCKSRSAEKVLKAAPKGTVSVVHAEAGAIGALIGRIEQEMKAQGVQEEELSRILSAIQGIAGKSRSADLYLVLTEKRRSPLPLLIVYTDSSAEEFSDRILGMVPASEKMSKNAEGKFVLIKANNRPEMAVADSRSFPQLGGGVAMGPPDLAQLEAMLASLNSGAGQELRNLMGTVDAEADVWGLMTWPEKSGGAPRSIVGSLYLSDKRASCANLIFRDADGAKDFEEDMTGSRSPIPKGAIQIDRRGTDVTVSGTLNDTLVSNLVEMLGGARLRAMRARSASNLHQISMALRLYKMDNKAMPEGLDLLVKGKYIPASVLVSPASGRTMKVDDKGMPLEKSDYVYLGVDPDKENETSLLQAYEPAELNKGKGGNALRLDGSVVWMDAPALDAAVQKTRNAMKK